MTEGQKMERAGELMRRAAEVMARVATVHVRVAAMTAANRERESHGLAQPYPESAFNDLIEAECIGTNAIITALTL